MAEGVLLDSNILYQSGPRISGQVTPIRWSGLNVRLVLAFVPPVWLLAM